MITIGLARWTPESATEIGKRSADIKPLPDFIKLSGPYMYPDVDEGIRAVADIQIRQITGWRGCRGDRKQLYGLSRHTGFSVLLETCIGGSCHDENDGVRMRI
jgi:hypothetical protein